MNIQYQRPFSGEPAIAIMSLVLGVMAGCNGNSQTNFNNANSNGEECGAGWVRCEGTCVDPLTDLDHCGATGDCIGVNAGDVCTDSETCQDGSCVLHCEFPLIDCNGQCLTQADCDAQVVIITEEVDEGLDCFRVETQNAVYYYDKAGAGFTSLLDKDGNDWIDFHPESTPGVPDGQSGWFRGIPNMGLNDFGHPGYTGAISVTADPLGVELSQVTIESTKDSWHVRWDFFPDRAQMTILSVGANYWLLYEGTPGGAVEASDVSVRASGESLSCADSWEGDIANTSGDATGTEWVYFTDTALGRSLFLMHTDDQITDLYYLMDPMTVFGFGRHSQNLDRLLDLTPNTLVIGLVDLSDYSDMTTHLGGIAQQAF